jgi:hypothetical protein
MVRSVPGLIQCKIKSGMLPINYSGAGSCRVVHQKRTFRSIIGGHVHFRLPASVFPIDNTFVSAVCFVWLEGCACIFLRLPQSLPLPSSCHNKPPQHDLDLTLKVNSAHTFQNPSTHQLDGPACLQIHHLSLALDFASSTSINFAHFLRSVHSSTVHFATRSSLRAPSNPCLARQQFSKHLRAPKCHRTSPL